MKPHAEIQPLLDRYLTAYTAHDAEACAAFYSEDAVILSPYGAPCVGRDAIRTAHKEWFKEGETNKTMTIRDAKINGDLGYLLAVFSADIPNGNGSTRAYGASLNSLKKSSAGSWQFHHTSLNELEDDLKQASK